MYQIKQEQKKKPFIQEFLRSKKGSKKEDEERKNEMRRH